MCIKHGFPVNVCTAENVYLECDKSVYQMHKCKCIVENRTQCALGQCSEGHVFSTESLYYFEQSQGI